MAFAEWADIAEPYDRSFGALCAGTVGPVLDALPVDRPVAGSRLLDVGTGTGTLARAAAARGWTVDAFDAEPSMIGFASRHPDAAGIAFTTATLPELPYPGASFDAVAANFCLNHVDHPLAALAELRRVARPGARFAVTVWPWEATPTGRLWREIQDETGARPARANRLPVGSDFDRSEDGLAGLLERADLTGVVARRVRFTFRVAPDDLWAGVEAGIAVIGYAYSAADVATRIAMRAAFDARVPALSDETGMLVFQMSAILASGVN